MQIKLPIELSEQVSATLVIGLKVDTNMRQHAERNGVGPEELQNLVGQRLQEIATTVAAALKLEYDADES
jgi:hypothetical protein